MTDKIPTLETTTFLDLPAKAVHDALPDGPLQKCLGEAIAAQDAA